MPRIAIVGAGISGLSLTYELAQLGLTGPDDVMLLERSDRAGGSLRTERAQGFTCEWGPDGVVDPSPHFEQLAERLGLGSRMVRSSAEAQQRLVFRHGRLHRLPTGAGTLLASGLLSIGGRLRVLNESMFSRRPPQREESVFEFARRRLGEEAAAVLADVVVTGIYAGNHRKLSLQSAFPELAQLEQDNRTLLSGLRQTGGLAAAAGMSLAGRLISFQDGMQELVDSLAARAGESLYTSTPVRRLEQLAQGFRLHLDRDEAVDAEQVVLALPAWHAATLCRDMNRDLAQSLSTIPSSPLAVVHVGFRADRAPLRPGQFGFLVPRGEGPRILSCVWSSNVFPGRAGEDRVLLRALVGGAHDPEAVELTDEQLLAAVLGGLRTCTGLDERPAFVLVVRHRRGVPQFTLGHDARLTAIERHRKGHPGLHVAGTSFEHFSVESALAASRRLAEQLVRTEGEL